MHRFTAVFWLAAVVHTIGAGSDAAQLWFLLVRGLLVVPADRADPVLVHSGSRG